MFQAEDGIRDTSVTGVQTFVSSRRRHTRYIGDWSSDVCSSDLYNVKGEDKYQFYSKEKFRDLVKPIKFFDSETGKEIGRASCRERV